MVDGRVAVQSSAPVVGELAVHVMVAAAPVGPHTVLVQVTVFAAEPFPVQ